MDLATIMLAASLAGKPAEQAIEIKIGDVTFTEVAGDEVDVKGVNMPSSAFVYSSLTTPDDTIQVENFDPSGFDGSISVND